MKPLIRKWNLLVPWLHGFMVPIRYWYIRSRPLRHIEFECQDELFCDEEWPSSSSCSVRSAIYPHRSPYMHTCFQLLVLVICRRQLCAQCGGRTSRRGREGFFNRNDFLFAFRSSNRPPLARNLRFGLGLLQKKKV